MDRHSTSPNLSYGPIRNDIDKLPPVTQSTEQQSHRDSSSDKIPIHRRRPLRASSQDRDNGYDLRDRRQQQDDTSDSDVGSRPNQRCKTQKSAVHKPHVAAIKGSSKKKPGPRPWASKPIKKNDMEAKKKVILEIEKYWGKNFIKTYIPKYHRPLLKRGRSGKRAAYRDHETDPKKWLPSVLKALLGLAKLTQDKVWLKKAMNDVVRYRIKNTGNRKPQLVTTDFDVLEDMLVKDWDVAYSFSIRYKHLLMHSQGQQETDRDIDHILGVGSGIDEDDDGDHDEDDESDNDDDQDQGDIEEVVHYGAPAGQYFPPGGYANVSQYPHPYFMSAPSLKQHGDKPSSSTTRGSEGSPQTSQPTAANKKHEIQAYSQLYPYGPPLGPWGQPLPYTNFGGYGGCGIYGGHGTHPSLPNNSMDNHLPFGSTDRQKRSHDMVKGDSYPPGIGNKRNRSKSSQLGLATSHPGHPTYNNAMHTDPQDVVVDAEAKPESPSSSVPPQTSTNEVQDLADGIGENYSVAALEAELRATELELKVARLQAKRSVLSKQMKPQ